MALTSSYTVEHDQIDGRFWVNEKHVDVISREHFLSYLATDAIDKDATLLIHAAQLEPDLIFAEVMECIEFDRITFVYSTKNQVAAAIRQLYKDGNPELVVRIARWIRRRIIAGDFTETQVRNAFGLTVTQWDALKIKLQAMDEALNTVETAVGE
jgi:hypothetical protein